MSRGRQKIHLSKPFSYELDHNAKALMEILSMIEMQHGHPFAFVGGFTRDYGKRPYNDFDICTNAVHTFRDVMYEMGVLKIAEDHGGDTTPHDLFFNPYEFDAKGFPIHFINTHYYSGYAPDSFDFSVNEFALKSDMNVYAPTYAWRDINKKIIRMNVGVVVSTNNVMRAVRFACRLGFTLEEETERRIRDFLQALGGEVPALDFPPRPRRRSMVASNRVISGIDKMIEDGVAEQSFEMLKWLNFPETHEVDNLQELRRYHNNLMLNGEAHVEHTRHYV